MSGFGADMLPTALGRRSRLLLALCLVLMVVVLQEGAAAPALSDGVIGSADLRYLAIFIGQCRFKMPKGGFPCDSRVALLSLRNGRSLLAFSRGEILYHLSGGHDRQPNPENYYLSIDSLGIQSPDVNAVDRGMEGECHFRLNRDASKFFSIECDVYNRAQGEMYNFVLDKITETHHRSF
jgi:hypothetical protein